MNANDKLTAFDIINQFEESKLTEIFWNLGEEREAKRIAKAIVAQRAFNTIKTTLQLADIIDFATQSHQKMKAKARIFQALRIFINRELDVLQKTLQDAVRLLHPDGRIVVISYHSLEDRIVKRFFREEEKECTCPEFVLQCNCKKKSTLKLITKKPVIPSELEKNENSRSRSAKMRVAEKRG
jgi:16S rRNA (cytosine1402-N4)-methyltransferase